MPAQKDSILIFYANGATSNEGAEAAKLAKDVGYLDVRLYRGGMSGWSKGNGIIDTTVKHIRKGNVLLIDLRSTEAARKGYIEGAVNIPITKLADSKDDFPTPHQIPIVFYGENDDDLGKAVAIVHSWGYPLLSVLPGGIKSWQDEAELLVAGQPQLSISLNSVKVTGEMSTGDIVSVIGSPRSIVCIDLRSPAEYAAGHLRNAMNIPLQDLAKRISEISTQKILVFYCSDGVRSGMAYDFAQKKGYRAMYLSMGIKIAKDGSYTVL